METALTYADIHASEKHIYYTNQCNKRANHKQLDPGEKLLPCIRHRQINCYSHGKIMYNSTKEIDVFIFDCPRTSCVNDTCRPMLIHTQLNANTLCQLFKMYCIKKASQL